MHEALKAAGVDPAGSWAAATEFRSRYDVAEDESGQFVVQGEVGPVDVAIATTAWLVTGEASGHAPKPATAEEGPTLAAMRKLRKRLQ